MRSWVHQHWTARSVIWGLLVFLWTLLIEQLPGSPPDYAPESAVAWALQLGGAVLVVLLVIRWVADRGGSPSVATIVAAMAAFAYSLALGDSERHVSLCP